MESRIQRWDMGEYGGDPYLLEYGDWRKSSDVAELEKRLDKLTHLYNAEHDKHLDTELQRGLLQGQKEEIERKLEQMRCCGNCGRYKHEFYSDSDHDYVCLKNNKEAMEPWESCDNWQQRKDNQ